MNRRDNFPRNLLTASYKSVGGGGGGGGGVAPDAISGLALWIDPSDAGTVSYSSGSLVSQVTDKASGVQGRAAGDQYFLAPSAAVEPTMETINGRNAIRFAGTSAADYMRLYTAANGGWTQKMHQSSSFPGSQWDGIVGTSEAVTLVAIIEPVTMGVIPSSTTYDHPGIMDFARGYGPGIYEFDAVGGAGNQYFRMYMYSLSAPFDTFAMRPVPADGFPVNLGTAYASTWRHDDPGVAPATAALEGGVDLAVAPQSGGEVQTRSYQNYWQTKEAFLGLGYSVGNGYCDVRIGEVCMWNRALSDAELSSMDAYFSGRWGT
jgi:hypothetical protein